jgi:pimeloyl-ACP methyl ester carboxylesterase
VSARIGHEPASGLYYERLGGRSAGEPPLLFVPGGGATGACWRATPDGRAGWADLLAARGWECWVTDWPGTGRAGGRDPLEVGYADVVDGYAALLADIIAEPVVAVPHSMGGAVAWQLVERLPHLVAGVVSVAGAYPANVAKRSEVVADDGDVVEVVFADTGVRFRVDRRRPYFYEDAYIRDQAIATSTRFPADAVAALRASLVGLPPRMVLQRLGVLAGMPVVDDPSGFAGKPIRLLAGGEDPAHTHAIETRTVAQLRDWGADARLAWLPERGIEGNGHYLMAESNSDEVLEVLVSLLREVGGRGR